MIQIDDVKAIVTEYVNNADYDACDAMEDICCVLNNEKPYYYNKIMAKKEQSNV